MDTILYGNLNNRYSEREPKADFNNTKVFKVIGDGSTLLYWNSSNSQNINHKEALSLIFDKVLNNELEGTINDGWNEIMFEIKFA